MEIENSNKYIYDIETTRKSNVHTDYLSFYATGVFYWRLLKVLQAVIVFNQNYPSYVHIDVNNMDR